MKRIRLEVKQCPICDESHQYWLEVIRGVGTPTREEAMGMERMRSMMIRGGMSPEQGSSMMPEKERRITKIFKCLNSDSTFEYVFSLTETLASTIFSVRVITPTSD